MNSYGYIRESLPEFLFDDEVFNQIIVSISNALNRLDIDTEDLQRQLFPQTCTWSIDIWENLCGINNKGKPLEVRRAKVIAKLAQVSPITITKVENIVKNFVKDSYVENIPKQYVFRINLNGEFNFNLQQLREVIEDIKPAHLAYAIRYFIEYIVRYTISTTAAINITIGFHNSAYNIPTHLLLNGLADLNGEYYLSGAIRPDGIKKTFYFITEKAFSHLAVNNTINVAINSFVSALSQNSITTKGSGEIYRFKALNGKYKLNGEINLSNKNILLQNI